MMGLAKPNLESGWLSRALLEPDAPYSKIIADAYNPYALRTDAPDTDRPVVMKLGEAKVSSEGEQS